MILRSRGQEVKRSKVRYRDGRPAWVCMSIRLRVFLVVTLMTAAAAADMVVMVTMTQASRGRSGPRSVPESTLTTRLQPPDTSTSRRHIDGTLYAVRLYLVTCSL